ncbi:RNA-directed DNA polymerase, eukaryota [Tanacetum coccineum]
MVFTESLEQAVLGKEDGSKIQDALSEVVGRRTVPQVFINGKHLGGSDDTIEAYQSGELAKLLDSIDGEDDFINSGLSSSTTTITQGAMITQVEKRKYAAKRRYGEYHDHPMTAFLSLFSFCDAKMYIHGIDNVYSQWMYAIGVSGNPTLESRRPVYCTSANSNAKEVSPFTSVCVCFACGTGEKEWQPHSAHGELKQRCSDAPLLARDTKAKGARSASFLNQLAFSKIMKKYDKLHLKVETWTLFQGLPSLSMLPNPLMLEGLCFVKYYSSLYTSVPPGLAKVLDHLVIQKLNAEIGGLVICREMESSRLPTRVNLSRRGVLLDSHLCPLCNAAMEDVQHVFFRCDVARVVLRKICRCCRSKKKLNAEGRLEKKEAKKEVGLTRTKANVEHKGAEEEAGHELLSAFKGDYHDLQPSKNSQTVHALTPQRLPTGHVLGQ